MVVYCYIVDTNWDEPGGGGTLLLNGGITMTIHEQYELGIITLEEYTSGLCNGLAIDEPYSVYNQDTSKDW